MCDYMSEENENNEDASPQLTWFRAAVDERITSIAIRTSTESFVTDDTADCIRGTHTLTRVHTLLVDTGTTQRTVRVDGAFGLTTQVRIAKVTRNAGADCPVNCHTAICVGTTRSWVAGVRWVTNWKQTNKVAYCKYISDKKTSKKLSKVNNGANQDNRQALNKNSFLWLYHDLCILP